MVQKFINETICTLLSELYKLFDGDELAYYSLQGKNELQIRDKIAWHLQCCLNCKYGDDKFIVRREWGLSGRSKNDMAVLKVDDNDKNKSEVIALFEFKAHQFVNNEDWPFAAFYEDVKKMFKICKNKGYDDVDMYFIFLHSVQSHNQIIGKYESAVAYKGFLNKAEVSSSPQKDLKSTVFDYWKKFFDNESIKNALSRKHLSGYINYTKSNPQLPNPTFQKVGESFGYKWYIAPMIWGPYKLNDIEIS